MCGVAGLINLDGRPVSPEEIKLMTDAIAHRGPDGEGKWVEGNVGIGHRRLAVIDLSSAAHQPMLSQNNRFVISYNGEVFNFREIRNELVRLGRRFTSNSDTEVVVEAWAEWGQWSVLRFNGMFAFAIWDREERVLHLVRDRYGVKPLYYRRSHGVIAFGSEQRAFAWMRESDGGIDLEAVLEYFTFQNLLTDKTFNRDTRLVEAGTVLSVASSGVVGKWKYWDFNFAESKVRRAGDDWEDELKELLDSAVSRQLVSDVEVGFYLSGGVDSGTITSIGSSKISSAKSFTCGFDLTSASQEELHFDERVRSRAMSEEFGTDHHEMVLRPIDFEENIDKVVACIEEPRVGQSYPNYLVASLAGSMVKVVLSGTGGDELFGGYPWRYLRGVEPLNFNAFIDHYYSYWHRLVSNEELRRLFEPVWSDVSHVWTRDIFRDVFLRHKAELTTSEDFLNHCLYFEARTFLHGLLIVEDKLSMAHGLETRIPFLDNELVDFAMRCPTELKVARFGGPRIDENFGGNKKELFFSSPNEQGKGILRRVMAHYVPPSLAPARKQGFSSPDASWFRNENREFVATRLGNPASEVFNLLNFEEVQRLLSEHMSGKRNRRLLIWSLLSLQSLLANSLR